jgi:2'-5' RNA ligase
MRTFIAAELGRDTIQRLGALIAGLKPSGGMVRWVKPENIHLTFKFLGEIQPNDIPAIHEALERAVPACEVCSVQAARLGAFPNLRKPRVLWIGLDNREGLERIHRPVERELALIGYPPEKRPFRPHLTLGRVRSFRGWDKLQAEIEKNLDFSAGQCLIDRLVFFESRLRPSGAEYLKLKTYAF